VFNRNAYTINVNFRSFRCRIAVMLALLLESSLAGVDRLSVRYCTCTYTHTYSDSLHAMARQLPADCPAPGLAIAEVKRVGRRREDKAILLAAMGAISIHATREMCLENA
jgi:hypothetical protein